MSDTPLNPFELDEILAGVHEELEDGASGARIREIAEAHPEARDEILTFAAEWFASDGSDLSDDDRKVNRTAREHHLLLDRLREAFSAEDAKPFDGLPLDRLNDIAAKCRIDSDILRQIVRGKVDEMSIPAKLIGWFGTELKMPPQVVWASLASARSTAYVDFFAPSGRKTGNKMSFAHVVRESDLNEPDKRFWLDALEP